MKSFGERVVGGVIVAIFIGGCYSIAHFVFQADDRAILVFTLALIWSDITTTINKPDAKAS